MSEITVLTHLLLRAIFLHGIENNYVCMKKQNSIVETILKYKICTNSKCSSCFKNILCTIVAFEKY